MARVVFFLIGCLLTVTAVLKLWMLLTDPFADISTGRPFHVLWFAVFAEVLAVYTVLTRTPAAIKWWTLVFLIGCFALISAGNVIAGKTNCGCAGSISISPIWSFAISTVALGLLFISRNRLQEKPAPAGLVRSWHWSGQTIGALMLLFIVLVFQSPSGRAGFRSLFLNYDVSVTPANLGTRDYKSVAECVLVMTNKSELSRTIIGFRRSCSCVVPLNLVSTTVPARGAVDIRVSVKPKVSGKFHQRLLFYLDSPQQYVVAADIFGTFREN